MITTIHILAQYLATAAICFLDSKSDDSHTNLGWINNTLETHPFANGDKLGLNYEHFSLEWIHSNGNKEHLFLNNLTHKEIVEWISEVSSNNNIEKTYSYTMHYELPYEKISNTTRYKLTNQDDLNELIKKRNLAQNAISGVLRSNSYKSSIRIWPHHFDTGAFIIINEKLSIGLGMSIPDVLIDDFYFYVGGYNGHVPIEIKNLSKTLIGTYYNDGWKGFALPVNGIDKDIAISFYQEAFSEYIEVSK